MGSMYHTKFGIKRYKGIKGLELDILTTPELDITVLVGLNESGKTTILEAIDFLQNGVEESTAHKLIPRDKSSNFTGDVSVEATVELDDSDVKKLTEYCKSIDFHPANIAQKFTYERKYKFEESEPIECKQLFNIDLYGRKSQRSKNNVKLYDVDKERWQRIVDHIKSDHLPKIIYYENFLFDFPEKIYLDSESPKGKTQKQEEYRKVLQDVLDSLGESLTLDKIHDRLKGGSDSQRSSLNAALLKMSNSINKCVIEAWDSIFVPSEAPKKIIIESEVENQPDGASQYYLTVKINQGSESYHIEERSLGFKWFFAFLLFTEYRKNRSTDKGKTLFLVDEPASNLHLTMQEKLTDKFEDIVKNSHLIYTTHSQYLINPLWLESTFVVVNKAIDYSNELQSNTKQTDIEINPYKIFASQHPDQSSYFQPILDSLEYKPSRLEMVPNILIVEGKYDYYILRYVWEVVMGRELKYSLYPGNGAGANGRVIALYTAWSREYKVLLDSDKAGKKSQKAYLDKFGKILEGRLVTLSDVSRNWKGYTTESFFSDSEKLRIIQTFYHKQPKYSKEKLNLAIQDLLCKRKCITLNEPTLARFLAVLKHIEK